jgi:TonB-linked SusC/RagA family outer membrane protein
MKHLFYFLNKKTTYVVLALLLPLAAWSQTRTVQGQVTLEPDAAPAVGVAVSVKGSTLGAITDESGRYSINLPDGSEAVLVFRYVGFEELEMPVGTQTTLDVRLAESGVLREVVVTALGIKKEKARLGYATQELSGTPLQKAPEPNVATSLTGRVAGLQISTKSTLFQNPDILLRGERTLIVIDGIPTQTDFWNISADDIESVNVLKGTAAAALYGSLGRNGAIMITTKKGKTDGEGIEVTFNSSTQLQAGFIRIPQTQDQYGMGWNGQYAFRDGKGGGTFDDYGYVYGPKLNQPDPTTASGFVELPQFNSPIDPATGERVPLPWVTRSQSNLRKFLRNEMLTTNNVSVAGKGERGNYRISLSHLFQLGQVPNTQLNSTTATMAAGLQISPKVRADANISYNRQYSPNYPSAGYGADNYFYNILLWMGPDLDINDLRDYWQPGKEGSQQNTFNYTWYNNPWYLANEYLKRYTNDMVTGQVSLTWDVARDLKFLLRSGVTNSNVFSDRRTPYSFIYYGTGASPRGNYSQEESSLFWVTSDALLTYNRAFSDNWELTLSGGGSHRFNGYNYFSARTADLNVPGFFNLSNSVGDITTSTQTTEKEVYSAYGYADLGFRRMVYVGLTGRNDWTSALQKPYNSYFYPSANVAVVFSEMFKLPTWVTYLKTRAAWANITSDVDPYTTLPTYNTGTRWNGNLSLELPNVLIAPDLKPNRTVSQEYGLEARFFHNRLGADLTYFDYLEKDFVTTIQISEASGYKYQLVNGGALNRRGVELALTATPIRRGGFTWNVNANVGRALRFRRSYYGGDTLQNGVRIGEREDVYRGWAWQRSPSGQVITQNGRPQYIDHVINLGHLDPDFTWGVGTQVSWRRMSLSVLIDGRVGGKMYNGVEAKLYEGGMHPASANSYRDESYAGQATYLLDNAVEITDGSAVWNDRGEITSDNRQFVPNTTKVKYIDHLFDTYVNGIDEAVLYDRTFAKLREVTFTWSVPATRLQRLPFKEANVSLIGRNLWLWSKVPFMDPDGYTGLSLAEPTYRNVGLNLNLKF